MAAGLDRDTLEEQFDVNLDECLALQGEIAAMTAETLEDAAVQAAIVYCRVDSLTPCSNDREDVASIRTMLASIILAVVKAADLDIDRLAYGEMGHLCALHAPGGSEAA